MFLLKIVINESYGGGLEILKVIMSCMETITFTGKSRKQYQQKQVFNIKKQSCYIFISRAVSLHFISSD